MCPDGKSRIAVADCRIHDAWLRHCRHCKYIAQLLVLSHYLHTTMLRLPPSSFRPLANSALLSSAFRRPPTIGSRFFSNGFARLPQKKPTNFRSFLNGSRTIMTEFQPMVQQSQPFSWQRFGLTAVSDLKLEHLTSDLIAVP
jgi:hypothetical protein